MAFPIILFIIIVLGLAARITFLSDFDKVEELEKLVEKLQQEVNDKDEYIQQLRSELVFKECEINSLRK